jgi:hypothetical protein
MHNSHDISARRGADYSKASVLPSPLLRALDPQRLPVKEVTLTGLDGSHIAFIGSAETCAA